MMMEDVPDWEPTVQKTVVKLRDTLEQLHKIWEDIGYSAETRATYCEQTYDHIQDLLNDMVAESEQAKQNLLLDTQRLMERNVTLSKELGENVAITGYEQFPLKELIQVLRSDVSKLEYIKEQRVAHLEELLAKERNLCKLLGTQPIGIENHLPTEKELNGLKLYLEKQEGEKNRLESIFNDARRSIVKMMDDLGVTPLLNFEHLVYTEPENFIYSSSNMSQLRELKDQLKTRVEEAKQQIEDMRHELIALWKYLEEPEDVCKCFLNNYTGYTSATIKALSAEVKRCKDKRRQNIAKCVEQVRGVLTKLWDLCKYSEEQRKHFSPFYSHTYTEDLLTLHELEVEKIKKFYENNKPIFNLLEEREALWTKMKELLQLANNPDRFYNRGGQLLMEEKERKVIQKKLPKIEEQLKDLVLEYENIHGEPFTINGTSIEELVKESWENLNEEKETIKKARKEAKDKPVRKTTPNTSRKAPVVLSTLRHTPLSSSKRKILFSPSPNTSVKRRNISAVSSGSKRRSGRVSRKLLLSGKKTIKESKSTKTNKKPETSTSQHLTVTETSYSQFKEHLEERRELRSSLLPEQVLANATKSKTKTPIRTPAKPLRKNLPITTTPTPIPKLSQSQSGHKLPRSPRILQPRLVAASTHLPIIF